MKGVVVLVDVSWWRYQLVSRSPNSQPLYYIIRTSSSRIRLIHNQIYIYIYIYIAIYRYDLRPYVFFGARESGQVDI